MGRGARGGEVGRWRSIASAGHRYRIRIQQTIVAAPPQGLLSCADFWLVKCGCYNRCANFSKHVRNESLAKAATGESTPVFAARPTAPIVVEWAIVFAVPRPLPPPSMIEATASFRSLSHLRGLLLTRHRKMCGA